MKKVAKYMRTLEGFRGVAKLFSVSPAMEYEKWNEDSKLIPQSTKFVIVSAVDAIITGPETYIFPANSRGNIVSWGELEGSYRGGKDHTRALKNAGYEVEIA